MSKWTLTWGFTPIDFNTNKGMLEDHTVQTVIQNNLNGDKVKVKFFNVYGPEDLVIEHAAVQTVNQETGKKSDYMLLKKDGKEKITVPVGEQFYSDELEIPVKYSDNLVISLYFKEKTDVRTFGLSNLGLTWLSYIRGGDFLSEEPLRMAFGAMKPDFGPAINAKAIGFSNVAVHTDDQVKLLGFFGDSITHMGYYTGPLVKMLYEKYPGKISAVNAGISGNRIQRSYPNFPGEGGGHQFGIAGKDRFLGDLYLDAAPDIVYLMQGVNDTSHSILGREYPIPTAEEIYEALREVIQMAHDRGSKVYIGTISPFGVKGEPWRPQAEEIRLALNELIRNAKDADDMIDIDELLRDPDDPHSMQEGTNFGDGVHPNIFAGTRMAKAIYNKWFGESL